jgi:pheromone shutdown protein TraB
MNSPAYRDRDVEAQFHVFFRTKLASGVDRARSALWEVRNLNIAAHIRRATAAHPGKRMLVIIGAGHKAFLDLYLSQMMDLRLVQLSELAAHPRPAGSP